MFATSVIYPVRLDGRWLHTVFLLNPMTPIINAYRSTIIGGEWPDMGEMAFAVPVVAVVFVSGVLVFNRLQYKFAERI
jgi:ABC-2 type transport system permease protein